MSYEYEIAYDISKLQEWEHVGEGFVHEDKRYALLQSKKHPEIGVWLSFNNPNTALKIVIGRTRTSAVCICRDCWPSFGIVARYIYEEAKSNNIKHIITRRSFHAFMMHEPDQEICELFGWSYSPKNNQCFGVDLK